MFKSQVQKLPGGHVVFISAPGLTAYLFPGSGTQAMGGGKTPWDEPGRSFSSVLQAFCRSTPAARGEADEKILLEGWVR